jgi:hypothetical protein
LFIAEDPQIGFEGLVCTFGLAIRLRVVGGTDILIDIGFLTNFSG